MRPTSRRPRLPVLGVLLLFAWLLSACGSLPAESWPGLTMDGDRIYLSHGGFVYAAELNTGKQIWKYQATKGPVYAPVLPINGSLYAGTFTGQAVVIDAQSGTEKAAAAVRDRVVSEATAIQDLVYFNATNILRALDPANLTEKATFEAQRNIWARPLLISDTLYVASLDHNLYALEPTTLSSKSPAVDAGGAIADTPRQVGNQLIFGGFDRRVHIFDLSQQKITWSSDETSGWIWGTPAVGPDGTIYAGTLESNGSPKGHVYAFQPGNSKPLWDQELDSSVRAAPLLEGTTLFVVTKGTTEDGGYLWALDTTQAGQQLWRVQPEAYNRPGGLFGLLPPALVKPSLLSTPLIANGLMYLAPTYSGGGEDSARIYGYPIAAANQPPAPAFTFVPAP